MHKSENEFTKLLLEKTLLCMFCWNGDIVNALLISNLPLNVFSILTEKSLFDWFGDKHELNIDTGNLLLIIFLLDFCS